MELAVFAVVFVVILEKVLQSIYKDYRLKILTTALVVGILIIALTIAVFEKISLFPVLLLFR